MFIIRKSEIHGKGVFAYKGIKRGKIIYKVSLDKIYNYPKKRCAYIGRQRWISDKNFLNFVNHSCEPNAKFIIRAKIPFLRAMKIINSGEEITVDYCLTEKGGKKVKCLCKSKSCNGSFLRK
jgi:uncharacterized protein